VTGDVTGLELAKVCQQSHMSVTGHNIYREWNHRVTGTSYWDGVQEASVTRVAVHMG